MDMVFYVVKKAFDLIVSNVNNMKDAGSIATAVSRLDAEYIGLYCLVADLDSVSTEKLLDNHLALIKELALRCYNEVKQLSSNLKKEEPTNESTIPISTV